MEVVTREIVRGWEMGRGEYDCDDRTATSSR